MEIEDQEQEILLQQEVVNVYSGGGAVNSVNGYTGDVVLTTSDLENTSDYQTGGEVESAISSAIANKQDKLTAGNNISISNANVISATDTTYSAGSGLDLTDTEFSVDTTTIATQQDVTDEATARENADIGLQGQIDAITASSDVKDIVGTYAALQAYDTSTLGNNDIIKVLQDETHDNETTYYRWSTTTETFTLIGEEGPYYTKSATDLLLADKQDKLTAGTNIAIASDNTISATDTTYTAGTNVQISSGNVISATDTTYSAGGGLNLNGTEFSVDTTTIQPKLTAGSNVTIDSNNEISATDTTYSNFVGTDGTAVGTAGLVPAPATTDAGKFLKADGTWDTAGGGGPTVVQTPGTSQTDVMSQNAVTSMVFADPATQYKIKIGAGTAANEGTEGIEIGRNAKATQSWAIAIGKDASASNYDSGAFGETSSASGSGAWAIGLSSNATGENAYAFGSNARAMQKGSIAIGCGAESTVAGVFSIGADAVGLQTYGYNGGRYRLLTGLYDPQSAHDAATKGYVDSIVVNYATLTAAGAPTTSTAATSVGQLYYDSTNDDYYYCSAIDTTDPQNPSYTWSALSTGGGGGPTVVQTTGTSTTDVMSQNAVTSMVYADPATRQKVSIGATQNNGSYGIAIGYQSQVVSGNRTVALGYRAEANANGAVALGTGASAANVGEVNIGSFSSTAYGFNNSNYRLLRGVYDGQNAHDAVTVGQVNSVIDSINSALNTNIPHIGASS